MSNVSDVRKKPSRARLMVIGFILVSIEIAGISWLTIHVTEEREIRLIHAPEEREIRLIHAPEKSTKTYSIEASVDPDVREVNALFDQDFNQPILGAITCTIDGYHFSTSKTRDVSSPDFLDAFTRKVTFTRSGENSFLLDDLGNEVMDRLKSSIPKPYFLSEMSNFLTDSAALCVEGAKKEIEIKKSWLS